MRQIMLLFTLPMATTFMLTTGCVVKENMEKSHHPIKPLFKGNGSRLSNTISLIW